MELHSRIKKHLLGKDRVVLDEILDFLQETPNTASRKKISSVLTELGWIKGGRKHIGGKLKTVWIKGETSDVLSLQVRKLELQEQRLVNDLDYMKRMLDMGFTHDQVVHHYDTIFNVKADTLDLEKEGEEESSDFANTIQDIMVGDGNKTTANLIWASAYTYYVETNYPELGDSAAYRQEQRRVNVHLDKIPDEPIDRTTWRALSFKPNFLDLTIKLSDYGEELAFKKYLYDMYISPDIKEKFLSENLDSKEVALLALSARKVSLGIAFYCPYGVDQEWAENVYNYLTKLSKRYD